MSFWSAWWRRRAAGVPDTARPAHGRADGDDRSGATGRQAAPEAVQDAATPQDGITVELRGLAMRFGAVEALRGLDARIPAGRITGLVGPDGAGKTTLLRLLAGLMEPAAGQALLFGRPAREVAADAPNSIGYMPQRFGLYEDLSVMANLRLHARLRGLEGEARDALFDRLLAFTSLGPFTRRLAGRLSGGMKQKLGIACALLGAPRVLLLDEPGVGVDPLSRQELWQMVSELSDDGMTVIWSTAYLDEAARCPGIIMLDGGRILRAARGEPVTVQLLLDGRRSNAAQIAAYYVQVMLAEVAAQTPLGRQAALAGGGSLDIRQRSWFNPNFEFQWFFLPNLIGMLSFMLGLVVTGLSIAREREAGTFDQLLVSPATPTEIALAKLIPGCVVGLAHGTIFLLVSVFGFGVPFTGSVVLLYVAIFIFSLAAGGIGLMISSLSSTQQQAFLGAFTVGVPCILLSGAVTPVINMPMFLQHGSQLNPIRHFTTLVQGAFLRDITFEAASVSLLKICAITVVCVCVAVWMFRRRV